MTRVVVTGAAGNLGRKAVGALAAHGVEIVAIDSSDVNDERVVRAVRADMGMYDRGWASSFANADAVLHLAAEPSPAATWARVQAANIDLSLNVLRAVEEQDVRRVVFASSNWVLGGYRFTGERLTPATPPLPVNPYGYSKAATERDCAALHARAGVDVIALRIGWCQPGDNRPGSHMSFGRWGQQLWLSNEDWCQAAAAACTVQFHGFAVLNVMSANTGMRWDLSETTRVLGYQPTGHHTPRLTVRGRFEDIAAHVRARGLRPIADALRVGARW